MGLFGSSVKQSSASATAISGVGSFAPINKISINQPIIDLTSPSQIAGALLLCAVGWLAFKRLK